MPLPGTALRGKRKESRAVRAQWREIVKDLLQSRDGRCIDGPHAQQDRNGVLRALRTSRVENEEGEDGKEGDCQMDPGPRCQRVRR